MTKSVPWQERLSTGTEAVIRCTSGRTSHTGCTRRGHQPYCLVWPQGLSHNCQEG